MGVDRNKASDARRRGVGTLFLGGSLIMVVWGQTALKPALQGLEFILYWAVCMCLTFLALMTALLDLWIVRRRGREQKKKLVRDTLLDIQMDKERDNGKDGDGGSAARAPLPVRRSNGTDEHGKRTCR